MGITGCGQPEPLPATTPIIGPIRFALEELPAEDTDGCHGAVMVDFDDDRWPDLTLTCRDRIVLYRNAGDGTFSRDTTRLSAEQSWLVGAQAAVWVDVDDDGDLDLFVTRRAHLFGVEGPITPQPCALFLAQPDGTMVDATAGSGLEAPGQWESAAFGDLDGDGDLDLAVAQGTYQHTTWADGARPPSGYRGGPNRLYRNVGGGRFEDMSAEAGCTGPDDGETFSVAIYDFDGDGALDVFFPNDERRDTLCTNLGGGQFADVLEERFDDHHPTGVIGTDLIDHDGDGCAEFYQADFGDDHLFAMSPAGTFVDVLDQVLGDDSNPTSELAGWAVLTLDADCDGDQDVLVGAAFDFVTIDGEDVFIGGLVLLESEGGRLVDHTAEANALLTRPANTLGLAHGDLDRDGDLDVLMAVESVLTAEGHLPRGQEALRNSAVLRNRTEGGRHLAITLRQPAPNSRAVGALAVVSAGSRRAVRALPAGGGYLTANAYPLHFGLGVAERPDWVFIRWPGGAEQIFTDVPGGEVVLERSDEPCVPPGTCDTIVPQACTDPAAWPGSGRG